MTPALAAALASGVGALARWAVDGLVSRWAAGRAGGAHLPYGTFVVNISGSFALGLVAGLARSGGLPADVAVVLGTGLAGGYTTLSTWALETLDLLEARAVAAAAGNAVGTFAVGLVACAAGLVLIG